MPGIKFQNIGLLSFAKQLEDAEKARSKDLPLAFSSCEKAQHRIAALTEQDRSLLMHILKRKQLLHLPGIYSRFFDSAAHGRCRYASKRGYIGLTHENQNEWSDCFSFLAVRSCSMKFGRLLWQAHPTHYHGLCYHPIVGWSASWARSWPSRERLARRIQLGD